MSTMVKKETPAFKKVTRSRVKMLTSFPFFGHLALGLELVEDEMITTAGTDGRRYLYNPDFINNLSKEEVNFLTAHEVLHAALGHIWRGKNRDKLIFNHAADYVINAMILECDPGQKVLKMIKGGLYDKKFDGMSAEEVYEHLINDEDYVNRAKANELANIIGTLDDHSIWSKASGNSNSENNGQDSDGCKYDQDYWKGRLVQATQQAEGKDKGKVPSLVKRMLGEILNPQKNWRQLLAEFIVQEVNDYGFNPPDRRFSEWDVIMPDFSETQDVIRNIVFAVDTSGSIGNKEFQVFLSEVVGCMSQFSNNVNGKLVYCDARIPENGIWDLEDAAKSMPVGGGGTDFRPVFDWIRKDLDDNCVGLVYLTDGEGSYPSTPPHYPVLWVLTQEYNVPFGMKTQIKT